MRVCPYEECFDEISSGQHNGGIAYKICISCANSILCKIKREHINTRTFRIKSIERKERKCSIKECVNVAKRVILIRACHAHSWDYYSLHGDYGTCIYEY